MTELPTPRHQDAGDVLEAKQRLLAYANRPSGPDIFQRHPALIAGAALVLGVTLVRVPAARMMVRAAALVALSEIGRSITKSMGTRL